jgi:pyochelin synthetase
MSTAADTTGVRRAARPQLPVSSVAGTAQSASRVLTTGPFRGLRQHTAEQGLALEAVLVCASGDVLAAWSRDRHIDLTVRRFGPHAPHATGLPAAATLTTIGAVTDPSVPFTDRVADTTALLKERADGRVDGPDDTDRCVLTLRPSAHGPRPDDVPARIHCVATIRSGEVHLRWRGAPDLPPGLIGDLADALTDLLTDLGTDPDAWWTTYREHLTARQRRVRDRVNATTGPVPDTLLHELFLEQARRTPDAPAVVTDERTLTYDELRTAATAVAATLHRAGTPPGRLVAVVADKGWEQIAAVLGILAAGAAYVPIAPELPERRLHHILEHAEADTVLTTPDLAATLRWPPEVTVIPVDERLRTASADLPPATAGPTDLAYVIYTSGSTGAPKGVMISHRAAANTVVDINLRHRLGAEDRVFALASLGFDLSVYDIFGPLAVGAAIVLPAPGTYRAPWSWLDAMVAHRVTVWNSVPALMQMLCLYAEARRTRIPAALRLVLMSGDWIPVTLPDRIRAIADGDPDLIAMGGATEASIWSNDYRITTVDPAWPSIPYGTPLTNQFFEVLDPDLRRRPDWVPGELYIGGVGLADGYWRDPTRTAASFIIHPRTGQRLYRTGDLGRYLPDGNLEFLGRDDLQVKIQGFRSNSARSKRPCCRTPR